MVVVSDERSSKTQPSAWQQDHLLSEINPDSVSAHAMCTGPLNFGAYNKALDAVKQLVFIRHADEVMCTSTIERWAQVSNTCMAAADAHDLMTAAVKIISHPLNFKMAAWIHMLRQCHCHGDPIEIAARQ